MQEMSGDSTTSGIVSPSTLHTAYVDVEIDVRRGKSDTENAVRILCQQLLQGDWLGQCQIDMSAISGGITNCLFKVSKHDTDQACLVRVFGDNTEVLIDRANDNKLFAVLAEVGFGPAFLGTFKNGRVEGYLSSRPLEPSEMSVRSPIDIVGLIASETARLHTLQLGPVGQATLWTTLDKWHAMLRVINFEAASSDPVEAKKAAAYHALDVAHIERELKWLKGVLPSPLNGHGESLLKDLAGIDSSGGSPLHSILTWHDQQRRAGGSDTASLVYHLPTTNDPCVQARIDGAALMFRVVFAHNDLLSGNILLLREEGVSTPPPDTPPTFTGYRHDRVQIIDYEYGAYNYCGFDLGNHFCEHAGFDFDLDRWYPAPSIQQGWLRSYLQAIGMPIPTGRWYTAPDGILVAEAEEEDDISAAFLAEALRQANRFALASHLWWGQWAVIQARHSPIDFDFMAYAGLRMAGYEKHKKLFVEG